jgi:putative phosphoesterase
MVRPVVVKRNETVSLRRGAIRLAVIADTHSSPHPRSVELVREAQPAAILHAGDIGSVDVLRKFEAIAPVFAVRGNIDDRANDVADELILDVLDSHQASVLRIFLVHIAVYGPKLRADVAKRARAEHAAMVVCGHSHVPFIGTDQGLTVFNPGSIGPRRFHLPVVFGILDVRDGRVEMTHVSCETGAQWTPKLGARSAAHG